MPSVQQVIKMSAWVIPTWKRLSDFQSSTSCWLLMIQLTLDGAPEQKDIWRDFRELFVRKWIEFYKNFKIIISWTVYECWMKELVKDLFLWSVTKWIDIYEDFNVKKLKLIYDISIYISWTTGKNWQVANSTINWKWILSNRFCSIQ